MNKKITLVIADDHAVVRNGLTAFLATANDIEIIAVCETGLQVISILDNLNPDVVLLDLFLPDQEAVVTVSKIKHLRPKTQIIIITSHEGCEYVKKVKNAGAISYILKDVMPDELINIVRKSASGEGTMSPRISKLLTTKNSYSLEFENITHMDLTARELQVLKCIADGQTNFEIAKSLLISEKTVKSHVSNILSKLYLTDRTQAAIYALRQGIA